MASWSFDGEGGMNGMVELVDEGLLVIVFVAVGLVGGDFPSEGIGVDFKFGEFFLDADLLKFGLGLNLIAEGDGVIKNTKTEGEDATGVFIFGEIENCLGVVVVDVSVFAPGHFDGFGVLDFAFADEFEVVF